MSCQDFYAHIGAYAEGKLDTRKRVEVERHAASCASCGAFMAIVREMTCRDLVQFLNEYVDGDLAPDRRAIFDRHLGICSECRAYLETYRTTIRLGRQAFADLDAAPPPEVPERLIEAILAARRKAP